MGGGVTVTRTVPPELRELLTTRVHLDGDTDRRGHVLTTTS